jgi:hypothetical protein
VYAELNIYPGRYPNHAPPDLAMLNQVIRL